MEDYRLPKELIAQSATTPKDHSRLMIVFPDRTLDRHFFDIIDYLEKDDVLVLNKTKVSRCKITGRKKTGGRVELILEKSIGQNNFLARIKASKVRVGDEYLLTGDAKCRIVDSKDDLFTVRFEKSINAENLELPLPPYIKERLSDERQYQTVYAEDPGSLAAPTAGLHFTDELLSRIEKKGVKIAKVTLHIGFSTFLPVRNIEDHKMHEEYFEIDDITAMAINERKGRLFCVGTTSVRALESAALESGKIASGKGTTSIFITPGHRFKAQIYGLITNFHLPDSTLLLLVYAFAGKARILSAYNQAIQKKYRFYSLGDAMLLIPNSQPQ